MFYDFKCKIFYARQSKSACALVFVGVYKEATRDLPRIASCTYESCLCWRTKWLQLDLEAIRQTSEHSRALMKTASALLSLAVAASSTTEVVYLALG
jgi:hypothetical protein